MALFFAVTLFTSALLLFFVQPMVGKMVLPLMGGSPSVWNTCMVFFQALLLGGYSYAHVATKRFGPRRQARVHLAVMALPLVTMAVAALLAGSPVAVFPGLAPQGSDYPFFGVVVLLAVTIGVPFFVISTSAPLLTKWFADTDHPAAKDPYFLYGASNLGSLLALLLYPLAVEPNLRLSHQGWLWGASYALLVLLTYGCATRLWASPAKTMDLAPDGSEARAPLSVATRVRWIALAAVPSSLMLSVTTHVTTDLSPIPLFWVVPLALYLLTFIVAFGRTPAFILKVNALVAPIFVLLIIFLDSGNLKISNFAGNLLAHLVAFTSVALMCHGELARTRPHASRLTEFFLWMSFGGVLGGLFNALVGPVAFTGLIEYPLALVAAALLLPPDDPAERSGFKRILDVLVPVGIFGLTYGLLWAFNRTYDGDPVYNPENNPWYNPNNVAHWMSQRVTDASKYVTKDGITVSLSAMVLIITTGVPALVCYMGVERPWRFGLGVLAIWLAGELHSDTEYVLLRKRSFFGQVNVEKETDDDGTEKLRYHRLTHGTTLHGKQVFKVEPAKPDDPASVAEADKRTEQLRREPLTYYHRTGPLGAVFRGFPGRAQSTEVAAIGLGTGSVAAYGEPGRKVTFYEIDAKVRRIAEDSQYFTYLTDCRQRGGELQFEMGDARLMMARNGKPAQYAVIVVDAFSSDAIPMHLFSKEAVEMYLSRLAEGGVICLHISNRYLDLEPFAGRIAQELGLVGLTQSDYDTYDHFNEEKIPGKQTSVWVMLARKSEDLERLSKQPSEVDFLGRTVKLTDWTPVNVKIPPPIWSGRKADDKQDAPLWTDDFSNLLQAVTAFHKKEASGD